MENAKVHIYTGDGKGKTTAAVGLAARGVGQEKKVVFFQFLKTGLTGEMLPLVRQGVSFFAPQGSGKFVWEMDEQEKEACRKQQQANFERACSMAEDFDIMVLDEVICAVDTGMLEKVQVFNFMKNRPATLELVATGRGADEEWFALADYVTEMKCIKHPYNDGVQARRGVEY